MIDKNIDITRCSANIQIYSTIFLIGVFLLIFTINTFYSVCDPITFYFVCTFITITIAYGLPVVNVLQCCCYSSVLVALTTVDHITILYSDFFTTAYINNNYENEMENQNMQCTK